MIFILQRATQSVNNAITAALIVLILCLRRAKTASSKLPLIEISFSSLANVSATMDIMMIKATRFAQFATRRVKPAFN